LFAGGAAPTQSKQLVVMQLIFCGAQLPAAHVINAPQLSPQLAAWVAQ